MTAAGPGALLELRNLRKSFVAPDGQASPIIDIAEFRLAAGEHAALRGGSGSGKTTLLNLISGILAPDSGEILIDGENVAALPESKRDALRARQIGTIFQTFNLLQGFTALENVAMGMLFGGGADGARARHLLERVGLADRMNYRPRQLSVGQQQRVAIARAVANRPRLVLADEPTGNLDARNADEALKLIREMCRESNAALLVVSHDAGILGKFERQVDLAAINRAAAGVAS